jgi:osmoprotectant transport system substrate-binding protein
VTRGLTGKGMPDTAHVMAKKDRAPRPAGACAAVGDGALAAALVSPRDAPEIIVGSMDFPEQLTLGELYAQALRAKGFRVRLEGGIGPSNMLNEALNSDRISMYPEYTGRICAMYANLGTRPRSAQVAYEAARKWEHTRGNAMLKPPEFHDTDCVVVRTAFAREHDLATIADLSRLSHFTHGGPPGMSTRYAGAEGLRRAYGLHNFTFQPLALSLRYVQLDKHEVDSIASFTADGQRVRVRFVGRSA